MKLPLALSIFDHGTLPLHICHKWFRSACMLFLFAAGTLVAADLSGDWEFAGNYLGDISYARVTLKVEGGKLTGNLNELKVEGTIKGDELNLSAKRPNG